MCCSDMGDRIDCGECYIYIYIFSFSQSWVGRVDDESSCYVIVNNKFRSTGYDDQPDGGDDQDDPKSFPGRRW